MKKLLSASNLKIRKNSSLYILVLITFIMVIASFVLFYAALQVMSGDIIESAGGYATDLDAFDDINFLDCGSIALSLMQVPSILIAIGVTMNIASENKNGSFAAILSKGYTRAQIHMAKMYESFIIAACTFFVYLFSAMLIGGILWHGEINHAKIIGFLHMVALMFFMYMVTALIFANISINISSGGVSIALSLAVILILSSVVTAVDSYINGDTIVFRNWWLFSAIEQFADVEIGKTAIIDGIVNVLGYGVLSWVAGLVFFKKREFK